MNKSILSFVAGIALCLGVLSFFAFTPEAPAKSGDILIVRATMGSTAWSKVMITYPEGSTEVIKLATFDPQNFVSNQEKIVEILNRVQKEGYSLIGTSGGGAGSGFVCNYWTFAKN